MHNEAFIMKKSNRNSNLGRSAATGQVPFGKSGIGGDGDLVLVTSNRDGFTESTSLTSHFDSLLKELLQRRDFHNLVFHWFCTIDHEGRSLLLTTLGSSCSGASTHFLQFSGNKTRIHKT